MIPVAVAAATTATTTVVVLLMFYDMININALYKHVIAIIVCLRLLLLLYKLLLQLFHSVEL